MKIDVEKLSDYAGNLKTEYSKLEDVMSNIETSLNNVNNSTNWDSPAKEELNKMAKVIINNFEIWFNKQNNVNTYLQEVIENYNTSLNKMTDIFAGF